MPINKKALVIEENGRQLKFFSIVISKVCETLFINILATVTSVMLSGYSEETVTVADLSNQVINLALVFLEMATIGAVIHMSMCMGRGDVEKAGEFAGAATLISFVASIITGLVLIAKAEKVMLLMNAEAKILITATQYFKIRAVFLPVTVLMRCFNNFLICSGYAHYTLASGVLYNMINVILCYIALYGNLNLPVLPINGVAIAGGIACVCGLVFSSFVYVRKKCPYRLCCKWTSIKNILQMGVPGGMNSFNYTLAQTVTTAIVASLGITVFNTKVYISSIIVFSSVISYAIAQAGAVFTGRYRGRDDFESIIVIHRQNLFMAIIANVVVSTILFVCHKPLIGLFTDDPRVIAFAGKIMLIDIAVQIFRAVNQVNDQALNANGDVKATFVVSVCACWMCSVLLSWLLGIKLEWGLSGVWTAFLFDEALKATVYMIRWKKGKWKRKIA